MPGFAARRASTSTNRLDGLRSLFVAFAVGVVLVGVVVAVLEGFADLPANMSAAPVIAMVGVFGVLALVAGGFAERSLDCSGSTALVESFSKRFFLRLALAESAALVGFVGYILSGDPLAYVVGLALAAIGFVRLAPTDAHLHADQQTLVERGCQLSLRDALTGDPER